MGDENLESNNQIPVSSQEKNIILAPIEPNSLTDDNLNTDPKEIVNMEVHHHPDLHHKPKPWKEYLIEFIMIFLAVTMGFFAENIREGIVNNEREHRYMESLVKDLEKDSIKLSESIAFNNKTISNDSILLVLLADPISDSMKLNDIFIYYKLSDRFNVDIGDSKSFDALKTTGDIRIIRKQEVLDSISEYYQTKKPIAIFRDEIQSNLQETYRVAYKIFNLYSYDTKRHFQLSFLNTDKLILEEYKNRLYSLTILYNHYSNRTLQNHLDNSIRLKKLIVEKYSLTD